MKGNKTFNENIMHINAFAYIHRLFLSHLVPPTYTRKGMYVLCRQSRSHTNR